MNTTGILFGLFTFLAIGLGFLWVIKLEYYVGARAAWTVAAMGAALVLASLLVPGFLPSAIMGVLGGTLIWGATELPEQEKRVAKGLFPANPGKRAQTKPAPFFLVLGLGFLGLSLLITDNLASAALGIVGMTTLWDAVEFIRQEERIRRGHAPANPDRPVALRRR
jgi:hypothetical protein